MTGGVYTGGRYLTSRLMDHFDFYGGDDILGSTEAIKKASLESGLPEIVSTEKSIEKAKEEAAKEELHEAMDEATKSIVEAYNVSPETQKELVKEPVEQKQQESLQLGNENALDKDVVAQAAAQAVVTAPSQTEEC
jgi:vacuolar-type H+-ATPase subunit H